MKERIYVSIYLNREMADLLQEGLNKTKMNANQFVRKALMNEFKRMGLVE